MRLTVLNPKGILYEGNAKEVVLPGEDGEFSVLDFHQAFLYSLGAGVVRIIISEWVRRAKKTSERLSQVRIHINKGLATMARNELVIITV